MKLHVLNTGFFKLDGGAMFGVVPRTMWSTHNPPDQNNLCTWALRCLLVQDVERVIVIDVSEARDTPLVLINPEVVWKSETTKIAEEGCLSVPGIYDGVPRAEKITVKALDENGVSR